MTDAPRDPPQALKVFETSDPRDREVNDIIAANWKLFDIHFLEQRHRWYFFFLKGADR